MSDSEPSVAKTGGRSRVYMVRTLVVTPQSMNPKSKTPIRLDWCKQRNVSLVSEEYMIRFLKGTFTDTGLTPS